MDAEPFRVATEVGVGMSVHAVAALIQHEAGKARIAKVTKRMKIALRAKRIGGFFVAVLALPASC
jgi:hypothetical protein